MQGRLEEPKYNIQSHNELLMKNSCKMKRKINWFQTKFSELHLVQVLFIYLFIIILKHLHNCDSIESFFIMLMGNKNLSRSVLQN